MKTRKSRFGLAILAGGLSFVGSASAIDIVIDGSYESSTNNLNGIVGSGGDNGVGIDGGWTAFTTYMYSAGYTQTGPAGSGQVYLRPYSPNQTVSQINSLTRAITTAQIDSSQGQYTVSAWFCTYHDQNDYSELTLQFLDASQVTIGSPMTLGGAAFIASLPGSPGNRAWGQDSKTGVVPPGARYASITTVGTALVNLPDGYVDLVSLDVTAGFVPINITSAAPANNATGVSPDAALSVSLQDGTAPLNTSSILMWFDGSPVTPTIQKPGATTSVQFDPPGMLAALSTHTYAIAYNNTGGATAGTTNQYSFTVAPWVNIDLGAPIYLETFDGVAEGALPSGWTVANFTDLDTIPGADLNNFHSDSFLDWTVISRNTLGNWLGVTPGGADFVAVTNVAPNQVINNALVTNLISTNFIIAVSDRNNNQKQIQYLFTGDYNLSGQNNVYLVFDSIWVQNQDSLASIEYSINGGGTWLPAQYLIDGPDILRDGSGDIDASNTFARVYADVPTTAANSGGNYGLFIGVAQNQWASLAPYLSPRLDDNQTASKRVELIRLAQADNQSAVRFRFANVGTWSWYWGMDNFGLYSIPAGAAPLLGSGPAPAAQTNAAGNAASITIADAVGLGPMTYQWRHYGTNLPGKTSQSLVFPAMLPSDAGPYDVVATNPGGSVTSAPPAVLTVINPAVFVTGEWDFNGNLAAFVGRDLEYNDATVQGDTSFGTTTSFGSPDINGQPAAVMHFTPSTGTSPWGGYKMYHQAAPNGGGAYVNQFTVVHDIYLPTATWRSLLQTGPANTSDGDVFISDTGGIGISSVYNGNVTAGAWHRVAYAFDLTGPGSPVLTKFIDGVKVGNQTTGLSAKDGRFALDVYALLFGDQDGDVAETYVSSVQFSNGRRPDAFIAALGGPSAAKIPGAIKSSLAGGNIVIEWTGGVPLQSADAVTGPWTTLGVASPYTPPAGATSKYYRPKIP